LSAHVASAPQAASVDPARRRRAVRRTATVLGLIALAFYLGFIVMAVVKAMH
jgi:hypothetical protein